MIPIDDHVTSQQVVADGDFLNYCQYKVLSLKRVSINDVSHVSDDDDDDDDDSDDNLDLQNPNLLGY